MNKLAKASVTTFVLAGITAVFYAETIQDHWLGNDAEAVKTAHVSLNDAVNTALAKQPGKTSSASLDVEDGRLVWNIEIVSDTGVSNYEIDATNSTVLRQSADSADF